MRLGLKLKKNTLCVRIQSISMAETICWIQHKKRIEAELNGHKDGKALYKLMNNAVYGKTMENLRNRTDVRLVTCEQQKRVSEMGMQTKLHVTQNIWEWFSRYT